VKHDLESHLGRNLGSNLKYLRGQRGITQAQLSTQAKIPRSTVATLEIGDGNPTLSVLSRLSIALQVSIEEILSAPRAPCQLFPKGTLKSSSRGHGKVQVSKLLPDPVPGMEFDRIELAPGGRLVGVPHRPGTREYLCCEQGRITLWSGAERYLLEPGDVAAFRGDQKHSYHNEGKRPVVGFSVVALVPSIVGSAL
jgi:transcriptional regulator with XRE-family HTH domain